MDQQQAIQEILEIVSFLKENAISKEDAATKQDLEEVRQEIIEARDEVKEIKTELVALRAKCERIEELVQ